PEYIYRIPEKINDGWETSSLDKENINSAIINDLLQALLNKKFKNIHSILIVKNGKLVLEKYYYGYDRTKFHQIRSATKSIGSILTGIAIDKGFISNANEKIYQHFKSYELEQKWDKRVKDITIKHLLTMTSGYDCDDHKSNFACEQNMYKSNDWVGYAVNLPMANLPGEHWAYNSTSLLLVGELISKKSDMTIPDFANKYLFEPMGITGFQWGFSPKGKAWIAGNAKMKPRDMAKFGYMVLNGGKWKEKQIVSRDWLKESTLKHVALKDMKILGGNYNYAYLWWLAKLTVKNHAIEIIAASGNGGQIIAIIPKYNIIVVFTGGNYNSPLEAQPVEMLIKYIIPAVM
ncbi:serine hydrolase, partial [Desulfobacterales bacterium HSG17]|nr:serine hydrolase [Desulfobacterales bacterium HSG17]